MKAYTDIEQTKKLAEILSIESADIYYTCGDIAPDVMVGCKQDYMCYTMCWSLAALLSVMPSNIIRNGKRMFLTLEKAGAYNLYYKSQDRLDELWETKEEPIDACYEMILKLYELKLL